MRLGRESTSLLNYFHFMDDQLVLLVNSNVMAGFELSIDPESFVEENYLKVQSTLASLLREGRRYYLIFTKTFAKVPPLTGQSPYEMVEVLRATTEKFLRKNRPYRERTFLLIELTAGEQLIKQASPFAPLGKKGGGFTGQYSSALEQFRLELGSIGRVLRSFGPQAARLLSSKELAGLLLGLFTLRGEPRPYGESALWDIFSAYDAVIKDGLIQVDGNYAAVLSLSGVPPTTWVDYLEELRAFPAPYHVVQCFEVQGKKSALATIGAVTNVAEQVGRYTILGPIAAKMAALAEMNRRIMEKIELGEKPISFSTYVVLYGNDPLNIKERVRLLQDVLLKKDANFVQENYLLLNSFVGQLPGHASFDLRRKTALTSTAADLMNPYAESPGDAAPVLLFQSQKNSLVAIDPFSPKQEAWNFFVTGSTGSGKSFFMNYYVANTLIYDPHVYIFDYGESYRPLMELLGAKILKVNLQTTDVRLNPFRVPALTKERLQEMVLLVEALVADDERQDGERKVHCTAAVREAFRRLGIEEGDEIPPDRKVPTLSMVKEELEKRAPQLATRLSLWTRGASGELYGLFFDNEEDNFSFEKIHYIEMTGFDADPKLGAALLWVLFHKLFTTMWGEKGKKLVIMDEVWKFLLNAFMAERIAELYRTARKFGANVGIITQHPDDILQNAHSAGIVSNAQVYYFLLQKKLQDEEKWKDTFKLNDRGIELIKSLKIVPGEFSEILVWSEHLRKKIRFRVNPLLYWLFTTKEEERRLREKYFRKYGIREGLARLIEEVYGGRRQ